MKYVKPFYEFFKTNTLYAFVILSAIFLSIAYVCFYDEHNIYFDIFKTLGFTLVSGGVFAVIVKSEQFSKIFQDELRNIIYGDEDLKSRSDLELLWHKVTVALCNQKFRLISKKLHEDVKKYYLPINHEYYYKNHNVEIQIEIDKSNPDYLVLVEETKTTIISDENNPICFKFSSSIPLIEGEEELTTYELLDFTINKVKTNLGDKLKIDKSNGKLNIYCDLMLNERKIVITRKEKKVYNLKVNSFRHHNAIWLYENFFLDLYYPKELEVKFIEMGVTNEWEIENKNTIHQNRMKATYNGLIFKKQGFLLLLNKI